jgi:hypothetical protein
MTDKCVFLIFHPLHVSVGATIFRRTYQYIRNLLLQCHLVIINTYRNYDYNVIGIKYCNVDGHSVAR